MKKQSRQKGISVLDILIVILIIAVIASIYFPIRKENLHRAYRTESRLRLVILNEAMQDFYKTAGGQIEIRRPIGTEDTASAVDQVQISPEAAIAAAEEEIPDSLLPERHYTEYFEDLQSFLPNKEWVEEKARLMNLNVDNISDFYPENFQPVSYPQIRDMIIMAEEGDFYIIYCPNGHGAVVNGRLLWLDM